MSMQMDAEFKKEQNGTLFCLGGGIGRGVWGVGGPSGVSTPKSIRAFQKRNTLLCVMMMMKKATTWISTPHRQATCFLNFKWKKYKLFF